jgi:hypothetical protein
MGRGRELPVSVQEFAPPFCPNEECAYHRHDGPAEDWPWEGRGFRQIERRPYWVRQLRCKACGRWFRSSVFGWEYWKKIAGLGYRIHAHLRDGDGIRQAARKLRRGATTVRWHVRLLAMQSELVHWEQHAALAGRLTEPVALDGLRTFAGSQYEPLDLNTAITTESGYVLDLNAAGLRRSGSMRPGQKQRRAERDERLGRPDPRARERAVAAILGRTLELAERLALRTDEEPDYAAAVARFGPRIAHTTVSSRARRDARNPLWKVNCLHGWARHAVRALVRETIAFSKTSAALLDRMWILLAARNNTKGIRERTAEGRRTTPAMLLGLVRTRLEARALFSRRRFPRRVGLPAELEPAYRGLFRARPQEKVRPYVHRFVR